MLAAGNQPAVRYGAQAARQASNALRHSASASTLGAPASSGIGLETQACKPD